MERRLRQFLRHERLTFPVALAESTQHAAPRGTEDGQSRVRRITRCTSRQRPRANLPPQAAGTEYFALDVEDVPVGSSRPDPLAAESVPQERVQRHTMEQMGDNVPEVPVLIALVLLLGSFEVGSAPLPPPARVRSYRELAAGLRCDLTRLEEVRQQTAMEVARWFSELVRRGVFAHE